MGLGFIMLSKDNYYRYEMKLYRFKEKELHMPAQEIKNKISRNKGLYTFEGIVFIIVGILAFIMPNATAIGFNYAIGIMLLTGGVLKVMLCVKCRRSIWAWISSLFAILVSVIMMLKPLSGAIALATILALFLFVEGITEIFLAIEFKSLRRWRILMATGSLSLVISILLFIGWPQVTLIFLSFIVGFNLIMYGISLMSMVASVSGGE